MKKIILVIMIMISTVPTIAEARGSGRPRPTYLNPQVYLRGQMQTIIELSEKHFPDATVEVVGYDTEVRINFDYKDWRIFTPSRRSIYILPGGNVFGYVRGPDEGRYMKLMTEIQEILKGRCRCSPKNNRR